MVPATDSPSHWAYSAKELSMLPINLFPGHNVNNKNYFNRQ